MDVSCGYLQRIQVRVELAGDAVEQPDDAPDEQQLRRYIPDVRAELEAEAPQIRAPLLPLATEQHPDYPEQRLKIGVLVYGKARLAEGRRDPPQIAFAQRAHEPAERGDEGGLEAQCEA